jgi:hypothetical protein
VYDSHRVYSGTGNAKLNDPDDSCHCWLRVEVKDQQQVTAGYTSPIAIGFALVKGG